MDLQLLGLIALLVLVFVLATTQHRRAWPGHPGWQYQRVFSVGFAGLLFFISGLIGWDLSHSRGWFEGTKWVEGPLWWQIGFGAVLLLLAIYWARRVPAPPAVQRQRG
jgi:hypothetical protein